MGWLRRALARLLPSPPEIGPDEDVLLVDVRTRGEYARGHAKGAGLERAGIEVVRGDG